MKAHTYVDHGLLVTRLGDKVVSVQRASDGTVATAPTLLSLLVMLVIICIALTRLVRFGPKSLVTTRMVALFVTAIIVFWTHYLGIAASALGGIAAWVTVRRPTWRADR